jgi:hypothetical protein
LTETLNRLPGVGNDPFCPPLKSETYQIVVTYEDRHLVVELTPYCVAVRDEEVRQLGLRELLTVVKGFGDFEPQGNMDFDPQSSTNARADLYVAMRHQEELRPALELIREAATQESFAVCLGFEDSDVGNGIFVGLPREPSTDLNAAISQARELARGFGEVNVAIGADACDSPPAPR